MSYTPEQSALKLTPDQEKAISEMKSSTEISAYLMDQMVEQGLAAREWDPTILRPIEQKPVGLTKSITVNGVRHVVEGKNEQELLANENAILHAAFSQPAAAAAAVRQPAAAVEQPRDAAGRFVEAVPVVVDEATKKALSLKLQLGQISVAEYLEQSGAVNEYLESQGVPLTELQTAVKERQETRFTQDWVEAVEAFRNSAEGLDWPGSQENLLTIGRIIAKNNLTDAEDKTAALIAAFNYMKENNLVADTPESRAANAKAEMEEKVKNATSMSELLEAVGYRENYMRSSGVFGR